MSSDEEREQRRARREERATQVRMYAAKGVKAVTDNAGKLQNRDMLPGQLPEAAKNKLMNLGKKMPDGMGTTLRRTAAGAGVAIDVADGVNRVASEEPEYRGARAAGVVLEKGVSIAPSLMVATGAAAVPVGATATAAFVIPAAAAFLIKKDTDLVVETMKIYDRVDATFKPDFRNFSNLNGLIAKNKQKLRSEGATFDANGRLDLTQDSNRRIVQKVINEIRHESGEEVKATHRRLRPRPMQSSENEMARMDEREADSALAELDVIRKAIAKAKKQERDHAHDPDGHGLAGGPPQNAGGRGRRGGQATNM